MARGRKSGVILWRPDIVKEEGPIFVSSLHTQPMGQVLKAVSGLPDPAYFHDRILTLSDIGLRWAIADVVRRRWYPKMRIGTLGREKLKAADKKMVEAEGLVLSRLLDITAEVYLWSEGGYTHYAYWWFECCREVNAHRLSSMKIGASRIKKRDIISIYEGYSAAIRERKNPFSFGPSQQLFDEAVKMANAGTNTKADAEHFYSKTYLPYLVARAELAKIARQKGTIAYTEKTFESK